MNFSALKQELSDRGYDDLSDTRLGNFINQGRAELDLMYNWPYRLATASGASPLTITDLGTIEEVANTARHRQPAIGLRGPPQPARLVRRHHDHRQPRVLLHRQRRRPDLPGRRDALGPLLQADAAAVGATDTPLAPTDYHMLYVDFAVRWARRTGCSRMV
jgi:hypothetical protein